MNRLVIHIEGGLVSGVYSETDESVSVLIIDFDTDGADDNEIMYVSGRSSVPHEEGTIPDAEYVRTVFTDWEASVTS